MRGVWVLSSFWVFRRERERERERKRGRCKKEEENLLPLPAGEEDGKQRHQNATVLSFFFHITVNETMLFCTKHVISFKRK